MQHKEYCQKYCKNFVWRQMIIRLIMVIIYANMKPLRNTPEINIFYFIYISIKIQSNVVTFLLKNIQYLSITLEQRVFKFL